MQGMSTEAHAVRLDLMAFAGTVAYPSNPFPASMPADLRLRAGGAAVDRGGALANVNDGFAGSAPDLGAFEQGSTPPACGPC
jgi:hypothetical protein